MWTLDLTETTSCRITTSSALPREDSRVESYSSSFLWVWLSSALFIYQWSSWFIFTSNYSFLNKSWSLSLSLSHYPSPSLLPPIPLHFHSHILSSTHSTGHRIQILVYDPTLRRVNVTRLLAKHGSYRAGTGNELTDTYTYEIWIPQVRIAYFQILNSV